MASPACRARPSAKFGSDTRTYELAGFGELTYHLTDKLSATGGLRYGKYGGEVDTDPGFNTAYFTYALFGISGPLAIVPSAAASAKYPSAKKGVVESQPDLQAVARPDDLRHGFDRLSHARSTTGGPAASAPSIRPT